MRNIQVQIIDSSVVVRQTLVSIIQKINGVEISGSWSTGEPDGLIERIDSKKPEVVVLGLDSIEQAEGEVFLKIRNTFPALPVIVLTPLTVEGAHAALFALRNGAVEFITKPAKSNSLMLARRHLEKRLVLALKMIPRLNLDLLSEWGPREPVSEYRNQNDKRRKMMHSTLSRSEKPVELVVIGGCTGGVQALFTLMKGLSPEIRVPVVVVQHMPKLYTHVLAEELDKVTPLPVREAAFDSVLVPGQVYIAPGGYHVSIRNSGIRKQISPHRGLKEHKSRPSIDVLIRSARHIYQNKILTVFLSGGGRDGILGAREVSVCGGEVMLQDRGSALLWDLPGEIYERGITRQSIAVDKLADEIEKRVEVRFDQIRMDQDRIRKAAQLSAIEKKKLDDFNYLRV